MLRATTILKMFSLLVFFHTALSFASGVAWGNEPVVGYVSQLTGTATIKRGFETLTVNEGTPLKKEDTLNTGPDGSMGIVFKDETTISLGPGSKLIIQEYVFDPDHSNFSLVVRLLKGTAAYVSGLISKLSPDATRFITPSASIGIRGTKFVVEIDTL